MAALASYGSVLTELAPLSLRDGVYWAVVTMTTVGYGDKTPKTTAGRLIAVLWMVASVALISILSTSIVSRMTAERVVGGTSRHRSRSRRQAAGRGRPFVRG
jgi:voltage-gated potassium channel Kch